MSGLFNSNASKLPNAVPALNVQQSSYGVPVTIIYGTNRATGNMCWYSDFQQTLVSTGGSSGKGGIIGGGGKGGGSQEYNYSASFIIGICEGQISGTNQVWASKQTFVNAGAVPCSIFNGALGQAPWGYLTSNHPTQADGYNKLAYAAFQNFNLGTSAETPQFSFEVNGLLVIGNGNQDAYPDQVITDFIERSQFPSAYIGSFTNFANYVNSMGFFISPIVDQQRQATDWLKEWMDTLNSEFIWSGGLLTIVPYGDTPVSGNGYSYTPNLTPVYALTDDDFLVKGDEDPVEIDRADLPDAYNRMPIEYLNRADQYNTETYVAEDQAAIAQYGVRIGTTLRAHHVTDPNIAQQMVYLKLWRSIYIDKGNSYTFKLPWNFILLDPMDLVTLTSGSILSNKLVRIKKIEEDEDGTLNFTAEDVPGSIALPALYSTQGTVRFVGNYNVTPNNVNPPVFFESPLQLTQANEVELNIAVSGNGGGSNWGGCQIWVSTDGNTYQMIDEVNGSARMGVLTANLANYTSGGIDATNTLAINMTESNGSFNNAAATTDATALNTICYVDGEFIAFGQDVLTASYEYNLTYLNRGCYGSTIGAHSTGANFVRYDTSVYRYEVDQTRVGQTLYFKFPSYNNYGGALQSLAEVPAYTYTILGTALLTPPANPLNLNTNYFGDIAQISWSPVTDIRTPIYYEIRVGSTFAGGTLVGRTTQQNFRVTGSGTYWVAALFITPLGVNVYSATPPSVIITIPVLQQNVIGSYDESATGWSGTKTNCATSGSDLVSTLGDATASYVIPSGHIITSNYICNARVNVTLTSAATSASTDITAITDITAVPDITFASIQQYVNAAVQVNLSQNGGSTWSGWQNWQPGVYTFNAINFQVLMTISNTLYQCELSGLTIEADVDDLVQTGTVNTSSSSTVSVTFTDEFNTTPAITCTIQSATAGDDVIITSESASGFTIEVLNSGSKVARTVTYNAVGY